MKLDPNTVVYSIVCGFFSIAAQILLLESLHAIDDIPKGNWHTSFAIGTIFCLSL